MRAWQNLTGQSITRFLDSSYAYTIYSQPCRTRVPIIVRAVPPLGGRRPGAARIPKLDPGQQAAQIAGAGQAEGLGRHPVVERRGRLGLRGLSHIRAGLAKDQGVPPYVVFHDTTLRAMAEAKPATLDAMAGLPGIGKAKLDRYGKHFLAVIARAA